MTNKKYIDYVQEHADYCVSGGGKARLANAYMYKSYTKESLGVDAVYYEKPCSGFIYDEYYVDIYGSGSDEDMQNV